MSQELKLYDPKVKVFYGKLDDASCRLIPAPTLSINTEFIYSNDTIIGYTYIITLTGQVTALDLRNFVSESDTYNKNYDFGAVIDHLHKMRNILSKNGSVLHVVEVDQTGGSKPVLSAKGGILRSFDFSESNNQWTKYANYSAQIEFHSLELKGAKWKDNSWQADFQQEYASATSGSQIFLNDKTYPYNDNTDIVNIKNFKIKSFQDNWSFDFDSDNAFNKINTIENNNILNIDNTSFQIQYTISAVGKNFYTYEDDTNSQPKLIPAWEQAKNFVQYRLYSQVTGLLDHVLENQTAESGCDINMVKTLQNAHAVGASNGLLKNIGDTHFMVFNEQISCDTSESEGSFSATYTATVKSSANTDYSLPEARHTITKNITTNTQGKRKIKTISLEGTIEGLIEGGLIRHSKPLVLPQKGSILIFQGLNNDPTKYDNAKKLLDKIYSEFDYNSGYGVAGKRDLKVAFKNALGITEAEIGQDVWSEDERGQGPHPISFNLTHNYKDGSISYSLEYSSNNISSRKYREISISTKNPTKVIATFSIPNSESCGIIQELGTYTTKTVSISIKGIDLSPTGKYNIYNNGWLAQLDCMTCYENGSFPIPLPDGTNTILTNKVFTKNPMDGSFTLDLEYICKPGCAI